MNTPKVSGRGHRGILENKASTDKAVWVGQGQECAYREGAWR